ncbi:MAG: hypothetical protein HC804_03960 [Anaerolineae bacterium]|nr:hypothetical protein [Anaerolineae bacterium]
MYESVDPALFTQFLETGNWQEGVNVQIGPLTEPAQINLIRIALQYIGPAVRQLAITSFMLTLSNTGHTLNELQARVIATYYVSGLLALLESYLNSELAIPPTRFQAITLLLLRQIFVEVVENGLLEEGGS